MATSSLIMAAAAHPTRGPGRYQAVLSLTGPIVYGLAMGPHIPGNSVLSLPALTKCCSGGPHTHREAQMQRLILTTGMERQEFMLISSRAAGNGTVWGRFILAGAAA